MLIVSYGIFHRRRRKVMTLIPLKARAGIAALTTFAAAVAPFVLATLTISVVAGQSSARANAITVKNTTDAPHILSDLFVRGLVQGDGTQTETILKPNDASDNVTINAKDNRIFTTTMQFRRIDSIVYSIPTAGGGDKPTTLFFVSDRVAKLIPFLGDAGLTPVFLAINDPLYTFPPPPEG